METNSRTTPPLANLSSDLTTAAIDKQCAKLATGSWITLKNISAQDWTFAALYAGYMAAAKALPDPRFQAAMLRMGNKFNWQLDPYLPTDNDDPATYHAVGQTYLELYQIYHQKKMMMPTKETLDALMKVPDVPGKPIWWWCDALLWTLQPGRGCIKPPATALIWTIWTVSSGSHRSCYIGRRKNCIRVTPLF